MSLADDLLINIRVLLSGAQGVSQLTGNIGGLTTAMVGLSAGLSVVDQVTNSVKGMVTQLTTWADAANQAATTTRVFNLTLATYKVTADEANGAAERLAKKFGLSTSEIQDSMTTLIRTGFTNMGQLEKVMEGAGASALAAGRAAKDGFNNIADAAATGSSSVLASIGISQNISTYNDKLAKSLGKTAASLNDAERAQALYNLIAAATSTEVQALGSIQNDYVKSQQAVNLAQQQFSIQLGQISMPLVQRFNELSAESTASLTELFKTYAQGGDVLGKLAEKYPLLTTVMDAANSVMTTIRENAGAVSGALAGALTPGLLAIAGTVTAAVIPALVAGATALWAFLAPLAPFILAGAAVGVILQRMGVGFDDIKRVAGQVASAIGSAASQIPAAWKRVQDAIAPTLQRLGYAFNQLFGSIQDVIQRVFLPLWDTLAPKIASGIGPVQTLLSGLGDFIGGVFTVAVNWVAEGVRGFADLIAEFLKLWQRIGPGVTAAVQIVIDIVKGLFMGIGALFKGAGQILNGTDWKDAWKGVNKTASDAWQGISKDLEAAWPVLKNQLMNLGARITMALKDGLGGLKSILLNALASMLEWAAEKMPSILQSAALKAAGAARAAAQAVTGGPQPQGSGVLVGAGPTLPGQQRIVPGDLPVFAGNIINQARELRGTSQMEREADTVIGLCARWVRDTLGDAAPQMRGVIDKMFRDNPEWVTLANGKRVLTPTADSAGRNFAKAGLLTPYKSIDDLKPGDTIIYDKNHIATYMGNGIVRGNNEYGVTKGRAVVSDEKIGDLGSVKGFVRSSDLMAYLERATGRSGTGGGASGTGGLNEQQRTDKFIKDVQVVLTKAETEKKLGTIDPKVFVTAIQVLVGKLDTFVKTVERPANRTRLGDLRESLTSQLPANAAAPPPDAPTPLKDTLDLRIKRAEADFTLRTKGVEKSSQAYQKAVDSYLATLNNVQRLAFDAAMKLQPEDAQRVDLAAVVRSTADKISSMSKSGGALEALKKQIDDAKGVFSLYTKETPGYDKALDAYLAVLRKAATESKKLGDGLPAGEKKSAFGALFTSTQGEIASLSKKDGLADRLKRQLEDARAVFQRVSEDSPTYEKAVQTYIASLQKAQAAASKGISGTKDRTQVNALSDLVASTRSEVEGLKAAGTDADKIAEIVRQKSEQRAQADVATAKQSVSVAQRAYDDGLKLAGDNATKKLEVVKKEGAALQAAREQQAQRDYQLAKVQADNSLKAALDAAAKGKPALREAAEQLAQAQHTGALNVAGDVRQNALLDARDSQALREGQDAVTVAVQRSRTEYAGLAATLRDKISTGKVDAQTLQTTLEKMDALDASTKKAGTSSSVYVAGAKANVAALYQQAIDSQIASGAYDGLSDSFDRASKAQGKVVVSIADAVAQMPQGTAATAEYLTALEALEKAGYAAGGSVQAVRDAIYQNGIDADIASGKYDNLTDGFDRAKKAQDAIVVSVQDAVDQIPSGDEAVAAYIKTLGELEKQGYASAGSVRAVTDEIKRQKNLEAQDTIDAEVSSGTYSAVSDGARQADGQIKPFEKLTYTTAELLAQMPSTLKGLDDFEGGLELLATNGSITAKQLDALKAAIQGVRDAAGPIAGLKGDQFEGRGLAINVAPDVKTDAAYGAVADENKDALQAGLAGAAADFLASALKGLTKKGGGKSVFADMIRAELASRIDVDNLVADIKDNPADYQDGGRGRSKSSEDSPPDTLDFAGIMEGIKKNRLSEDEVLKLLGGPGFTKEQIDEAKAYLITSHQDLLDTQRAQTAAHLEIEKQLGLVSEADYITQKASLDKQGIEAAFTRATANLAETDKAYVLAAAARTQQLSGIDEKADADRRLLSRQRQQSSEDALSKLEEAAADRRHTLGLSSDLEYSQEKENLQLAAIERQHQRALAAAGVDIDLQNAADREAEAQGIAVTTQGEEERRVIRLNLRRTAEDAVTALSTAQEEARYKAGAVSEQDHLTASLTARRLAAQRVYGRALEDAKGNADKVAAAELALQTTLTQIDSDGAEAQISLADKAAAAKVKAAQRKVTQGNGYDFSANAELQGALIDQISQYRSELVGGALDNDKYRATVEALESAEDALRAARETQINTFEKYAQQAVPMVTAAMQALGGTSEEVAGQWGQDLSSMVGDIANFSKAIARGDYVSAAIQGLTSIFTFFSKRAEAFRAELKKTTDYGKQFRFNQDGYGTRQSEQYTTGILFWQTTHFKETIDEPGKALALSLEGGIVSGVEGGFKAALASGDKRDFTKSIYDGLKEVAFKGLVDGFLNSAPVIAVFGPLVQKLMEAFKSGNKEMIGQAVSDFKTGVASLQPEIDGLLEAGKAIDDSLTTPEEKARKAQAAANELTQGRINNVQTLYDLQNRSANAQLDSEQKLKVAQASTDEERNQIENEYAQRRLKLNEAYQRQKLATALETDRLEMENALAATGITEEQKAVIRQQYLLKSQGAQQDFDEWLLGQQTDIAVTLAGQQQAAADKAKQLADEAKKERETTLSSWRQSLAGGIQAMLSGDNSLQALYKGVRDRISQAIQDGFIAKRILSQLDPLFEQLDNALSKGLDGNSLIQQIGAALPGLQIQLQTELSPLISALNSAIPDLTKAVNGNTAALREVQFQSTMVVSYNAPPPTAGLRGRLPRLA